MAKRKVIDLNRGNEGEEYLRESVELLRDLSPSNLSLLRGILMKSSLESLQDYYIYGYLVGVQQVSVSVEELEKALNVEWGFLNEEYVKNEKGEGNLTFFFPIGLMLESVLPNDLVVLDERDFHHEGDEVYIEFNVTQV